MFCCILHHVRKLSSRKRTPKEPLQDQNIYVLNKNMDVSAPPVYCMQRSPVQDAEACEWTACMTSSNGHDTLRVDSLLYKHHREMKSSMNEIARESRLNFMQPHRSSTTNSFIHKNVTKRHFFIFYFSSFCSLEPVRKCTVVQTLEGYLLTLYLFCRCAKATGSITETNNVIFSLYKLNNNRKWSNKNYV